MNNFIRFAVGIIGNAASLLLYGTPIVTFMRVIKKRTTGDFSGIPYVVSLLNCLLYTLYGSPLISNGWENILVATVNGVGIIFEWFFVCTYLIFAPSKAKRAMAWMFGAMLILFGAVAIVSQLALHDHKHRKLVVGSAGMVVTIVVYGSPLSVIRLVIRTKSVEFMPFYLSLFTFLTSVLWTTYGLLGRDMIIAAPNIVGLPLGSAQIILYCMYRDERKQPICMSRKSNPADLEMALKQNSATLITGNANSLAE